MNEEKKEQKNGIKNKSGISYKSKFFCVCLHRCPFILNIYLLFSLYKLASFHFFLNSARFHKSSKVSKTCNEKRNKTFPKQMIFLRKHSHNNPQHVIG